MPADNKEVFSFLDKVLNHPDVRPIIEKQGYRPGGDAPQVFGKFLRADVDKFTRVIKAAGIKPEG